MRLDAGSIIEKRQARRNVILFTGGTGFLGSHIAVELLKRGYGVIFLCRPKDGLSAEERVRRLLRWFDLPCCDRVRVLEGHIARPRLGLGEHEYAYLREHIDEVFHCAGETSFVEIKRAQAQAVNIQGTRNVLELAAQSRCYFFHHLSTAYVAGQRSDVCHEEYAAQERFCNAYEETKHAAEGQVLQTCRREGIRANLYRPSIVYGDSRSGRSLLFNAFYFPTRLAHYMKAICEKDLSEGDGQYARRMGVYRTSDGRLHVTARIERTEGGALNLIPVDFLTAACMALMDDGLEGDIFHLVNKKGDTLDELLPCMQRFLNLTGIQLVPRGSLQGGRRNALESLIADQMAVYDAYFHDHRVFDASQANRILARHHIACPQLNYAIFARCVEYAIRVQWGKRLFEEEGIYGKRALSQTA